MIVRELTDDFIMITQDDHAHISGQLVANWKDSLFKGVKIDDSVEYAIANHDCAWKPVDEQPFWNDQTNSPYTFIEFPTPAKIVFYKHGIDQLEQHNDYAAILCSEHYKRFILSESSPVANNFVKQEDMRQQRLIGTFHTFGNQLFATHYELLKLCDSLSLYICLNEPGVEKEQEHPFFRDGIPVAESLKIPCSVLRPYWEDARTIVIPSVPAIKPITIRLKQKIVPKKRIHEQGLVASFEQTPLEEIEINVKCGDNATAY